MRLMIITYTCFDWMTGRNPHLTSRTDKNLSKGQLHSSASRQRPACARQCHSMKMQKQSMQL